MESERKRTVMIAIDGGEYAEKAFDYYCDNVRKDGDYICLVHIPELYELSIASPAVVDKLLTELKQGVEAIENKYKKKMQERKLPGKFRTGRGKPGEVICKFGNEEHSALIIVGSRGLGKFRRTLLGSVSDYIVHHSHVPVIVYKHK